MSEEFPNKHWFKNTPENVAEFKRRFPDTKPSCHWSLDALFAESKAGAFGVGYLTDNHIGFSVDPEGYRKAGLTEFKFEHEKAKQAEPESGLFPEKSYMAVAPDQVEQFRKKYAKTMWANSMPVSEWWPKRDGVTYVGRVVGGLTQSGSEYSFSGSSSYKRIELDARLLQLREGAWYQRNDGKVVGPCLPCSASAGKDGYKWAMHGYCYRADGTTPAGKNVCITKEVPEPGDVFVASQVSGQLVKPGIVVSCGGQAIGVAEKISFGPKVDVVPGFYERQSEMVSKDEMEQIASMVVSKMRGKSESAESKPSLLARTGSFAWGATKGTLGYAFAPLKGFVQYVVFLASMCLVGYGAYKTYDFAKGVQLPHIEWSAPAESSPSDSK